VDVLGAVGSDEVCDWVFRLKLKELVEYEAAFRFLDSFARLVTHNLTFPPNAGGERAVRVGGVATESSRVVETICESYAGKPFRPTTIPPDMKAALNALAPYSVGRRDFRIIEEDCSASSPV
jgi:hypothetical protein